MVKASLTAIFIMVGTLVGASILGMPYVFAQVGYVTGLLLLFIVGVAATLMSLYVGELALRSKDLHQISGFALKYFGKTGRYITILIETFGLYTALIAYLIAIGLSLSNLFGGSPVLFGTLFFVLVSPIIFVGMMRYDQGEALISLAKIILLIFFSGVFLFSIKPITNFENINMFGLFYPFGIVLFACLGYTAIPKMKEILKGREHQLHYAIIAAMAIAIGIYAMFTLSMVGTFGTSVNEVALVGLPSYNVWGNLFVLLAVITPFVIIADAVKHVYVKDLGMDKRVSWFLAAFIPFLIYIYVKLGFVNFLQISGTYSGGFLGILIGLLILKARSDKKGIKPQYTVPGGNAPVYIMMAIFGIGIILQTLHFLGL